MELEVELLGRMREYEAMSEWKKSELGRELLRLGLSYGEIDPAGLRLFKRWSEYYLPPDSGWRARLNLHADNDEPAARHWRCLQTGNSVEDFTKSYVKPDGTGHRKNHLPYGVCTLIKRRAPMP